MIGGKQLAMRPATPADESFLRTLFADSRPDLAQLPEPVRSQLIDLQFRAQRQQYRQDAPDSVEQVVELAGEPIGRLWISAGAESHRLLDIVIDGRCRGQGLGSALLAGLQTAAARAGVPLRLHVWSQNAAAVRLYQRLGFQPVGDSNGYLALQWNSER